MKFEKRLIVLSGENNAKGTVTLERNAYGTFATFNVYNIPDLMSGEYAVGLKNSELVFTRKLGSMGRILSRFKISDMDLDKVHCVIYDTATETPLLYGCTPGAVRLWTGNMMDGIRSRKLEFPKTTTKAEIEKSLPSYSDRPQEIEDYFLDILPRDGSYRDAAVAQVNYYPSDMSIEVSYTGREQSGYIPEENPVDKHFSEKRETPPEIAEETPDADSDSAEKAGEKIAEKAEPQAEIKEKVDEETAKKRSDTYKETATVSDSVKVQSEESEQSEAAATVIPPVSEFTPENALKDVKTETVFYEQIKGQISELFGSNPRFELLENAMPDTKWIRVEYDGSGKYYVVGLIGDKPDYICYGVPATFTPEPPDELDGYCQWLPTDPEKPEGDGFWIMYQDAVSGDSVKR